MWSEAPGLQIESLMISTDLRAQDDQRLDSEAVQTTSNGFMEELMEELSLIVVIWTAWLRAQCGVCFTNDNVLLQRLNRREERGG